MPVPRGDWFTRAALDSFSTQAWRVVPSSNRMGIWLASASLERRRDHEPASEGTMTGSIQMPQSGLPEFFLADHPVVGGYPGARVRFPLCLDAVAVPIQPSAA
ncbi:hypothetical protein [Arthrobacter alpinus]|uniref:hypothetical protein n=1 Tax=Arthrobacter alpinus TaxID=656366 RepID=UPI003C728AEC